MCVRISISPKQARIVNGCTRGFLEEDGSHSRGDDEADHGSGNAHGRLEVMSDLNEPARESKGHGHVPNHRRLSQCCWLR